MSDNLEHKCSRVNSTLDALSDNLLRITNLSQRVSQSSVNAQMGQEDVWRLAIEQMVKSEGLGGRIDTLEKKESVSSEVSFQEKSLSSEVSFQERLSKIVNEFQSCVPIFVGSLGVLLTISLPCDTVGLFLYLTVLGCCVLSLLGGLAIFRICNVRKEVAFLERIRKTGSDGRTYLPQSAAETSEITVPKFTLWCYVWSHVMRLLMLVVFSMAFAASVAMFVYTKTCGAAPAPAPAPVEEGWPVFLGYGAA